MYKIEKVVNFNEWDGLVSNSIYNNIFFKTFFFKYLKKNIDLKFIKRGNIIKAGFFLIKNNKKTILDDEIIIHSGLILFKNEKKKQSSLNIENYDIISFFVDYITKNYQSINFSTIIDFPDLRPFQWHNFGSKKKKFFINPRYTSKLDISDLAKNKFESNTFKNMSSERKRLLRIGIKKNALFKYDYDLDFILEKYQKFMFAQNNKISSTKIENIKNIILNLEKQNKIIVQEGYYIGCNFSYILIFTLDDKTSTFLYGFPIGNIDNTIGTISFWKMFNLLAEKDVKYINLEGINSPNRGQFKQSFGGINKVYYNLKYNFDI